MPTDQESRNITEYCAHDIHSNVNADHKEKCYPKDKTEFCLDVFDVDEDSSFLGTTWESWAQNPKERKKLLQKAQMAINKGMTKAIIFVSGDQHWGEIMAKQMPPIYKVNDDLGEPRMLFEVTASGIYQNWPHPIENSNRFKDGVYEHIKSFSNLTTTNCTGSEFHTCSSDAHYGMINVDFDKKIVRIGVRAVVAKRKEEAYIDIPYAETKCPPIGHQLSPIMSGEDEKGTFAGVKPQVTKDFIQPKIKKNDQNQWVTSGTAHTRSHAPSYFNPYRKYLLIRRI